MLLMALPPFASELVAALLGALVVLVARRRAHVDLGPVDNTEARIADLTDKHQHPLRYRLNTPRRWLRN